MDGRLVAESERVKKMVFVTLEMLRAAKAAEIKADNDFREYLLRIQKYDTKLDRLQSAAIEAGDNFLTVRKRFQECFGVRKRTALKMALDNQSTTR